MKRCALLMASCVVGLALAGCVSNGADPAASAATGALAANPPRDGVVVYYMHRTFRCPTCLKIEKMSREAVQDAFVAELSSGSVRWRTLNYQEHEDLAERYGVSTSSLVLVVYRDGREASHQVLEETWSLYGRPEEFYKYVAGAVRERLDSAK